jgi:UDP-glucuronate 4-epimerase
MAQILVTGVAGFIGYHVAEALLARGDAVVGIDNVNDYYDVRLKEARLARLTARGASFRFKRGDIADREFMDAVFDRESVTGVVHLAAQAGVRYSLVNPHAYVESNVCGFLNVLEGCRRRPVQHLVYASSSSVYGANTAMPFSVHDGVNHPLSLYAATKKANELMAHSYSHLYAVPTTGLRFFTVYGPWGRPDMALFKFTSAILAGKPIEVYNHGQMKRDFTYIDDIVEAVVRVLDRPASADPAWRSDAPDPSVAAVPYKVYNIGNSQPEDLLFVIALLERRLGCRAEKRMLDMQPGDVPATFSEVAELERDVGFRPKTSIEQGLGRFVDWYREYYRIDDQANAARAAITLMHPSVARRPAPRRQIPQSLADLASGDVASGSTPMAAEAPRQPSDL